jgi:hypothetical protein
MLYCRAPTQLFESPVAAAPRLSPSYMIAAGPLYTCAVLTNRTLRCFGQNTYGQLGLGNTDAYGDESSEVGTSLPTVDIGQRVKYITAGNSKPPVPSVPMTKQSAGAWV